MPGADDRGHPQHQIVRNRPQTIDTFGGEPSQQPLLHKRMYNVFHAVKVANRTEPTYLVLAASATLRFRM
uniref:Uncharacterized protein n=1 Tax=Romanomermis culicivorax TaxID=13658 RepID=A0A915KI43_ROMCU